jgi:hypothetical protein
LFAGSGHDEGAASVVDRGARQREARLAQPREVCGDQLMPLLALATLGGEVGG